MNLDTDISTLRDELEDFRTKSFDPNFQLDSQKVEEYRELRDLFLHRKSIATLIERIGQGSLACTEKDEVKDEDMEVLKVEAEKAIEQATQFASSIQESLQLLKTKQLYGVEKSDEMDRLVLDSQFQTGIDCCGEEVDEEEVAETEQELTRLRKKRAEAQIRLQFLTEEKYKTDKAVQDIVASKHGCSEVELEGRIAAMEKENRALVESVEKNSNMERHYVKMTQISESMSGIRVLDVDGDRDETSVTLRMRIQLLEKYNLRLIVETKGQDSVVLQGATFYPVHPTILGPDDDDTERVELVLPPLDTILSSAAHVSHKDSGDSVRFFLSEVKQRLRALELRVNELNALQRVAMTKIGPLEVYGQQVVCSLNHAQLTLVLNLTVDCPLSKNSVHLEELVGYGGWEKALLDTIEQDLRSETWHSPVALVERCSAAVQRLQQEHGVTIVPNTPRLPLHIMWK